MANPRLQAMIAEQKKELENAKDEAQTQDKEQPGQDDEDSQAQVPDDERHQDPQQHDSHDDDESDTDDTGQDDGQSDESQRFNRLRSKVSKVEKGKAEAERRLLQTEKEKLELERRLIELERQQEAKAEAPKEDAKSNTKPDDDAEQQIIARLGQDTWDYLDDAQRQAFIAMFSEVQHANPKAIAETAEKAVQSALTKREQTELNQQFIRNLNNDLKPLGMDFVQLANSDDFEEWLRADRKRVAVFEQAVTFKDDRARQDITDMVREFKGDNATPEKPNTTTPNTRKPGKADRPKTKKITYEQYQQAMRDLIHPPRRKAAQQVIDAWHKQEQE